MDKKQFNKVVDLALMNTEMMYRDSLKNAKQVHDDMPSDDSLEQVEYWTKTLDELIQASEYHLKNNILG